MTALGDWLDKQARRQDRIVLLQDAFLANQYWRYALYRLRLFFPRFGTETALHLVRVFVLVQVFSQIEFVAALVLFTLAAVVKSFWWGSLEVLRERVRELHRAGKAYRVPDEVGRWLGWATRAAGLVLAAGVTATTWRAWTQGWTLQLIDVYVVTIYVSLALNLVAQCYHSGVFATRRIYRPLWAVLGVDLVSFVAVLSLWPWLGAWSFPAAELVSATLAAGLTFHFTARMYRLVRVQPWAGVSVLKARSPLKGSRRTWWSAGSANAIMRMDALLVLALFAVAGPPGETTPLFVFFFAVGPAVRAGADWAKLFYFDLKRLSPTPFRNLQQRLERFVYKLAVAMAFLTWGVACLVATLAYQTNFGDLYLLLFPFFFVRSLLSAAQVRAFVGEAYGEILVSGLVLALGVGSLVLVAGDVRAGLVLLSLSLLVAALLLIVRGGRAGGAASGGGVDAPTDWLAALRALPGPACVTVVRSARMDEEAGQGGAARATPRSTWYEERIAERVARRLGDAGRVTFIHPDRIAWYERTDRSHQRVDAPWLAREVGGVVAFVGETGPRANGERCVAAACSRGLLGRDFERARRMPEAAASAAQAANLFRWAFPDGIVYDVERPAPSALEGLTEKQRRGLIRQATRFARDLRGPAGGGELDVTAFVVPAGLRLIFVVDPGGDREAARRWRSTIRQIDLRVALNVGAARAPPAKPVFEPVHAGANAAPARLAREPTRGEP